MSKSSIRYFSKEQAASRVRRWALPARAAACVVAVSALGAAPAQAQASATEGTLFQYTPRTGVTALPTGVAPTGPLTPVLPLGTSVNVLILALDAADIASARMTNIAPLATAPGAARPRINIEWGKPAIAPPTAAEPPREMPQPQGARPPAPEGNLLKPPPGEEPPPVAAPLKAPENAARENAMPLDAQPALVPNAAPGRVLPQWIALAQQTDNVNLNLASAAIPALPKAGGTLPTVEDNSLEPPSRRPPGRAQQFAAPLRRAFNSAGIRDVLTTALDGPSVLRSVNNGRLSLRTLDILRFTTGQMLDAARAGADRFTAEGNAMEKIPTPPAPSVVLAQARQNAIAAASRIGLTMGYRAVVVLAVVPDERPGHKGAVYSFLVVDAPREAGEAYLMRKDGSDPLALDAAAATSAAQNISAQVRNWPAFTTTDRAIQVEKYLASARMAIERNDLALAQDQLQLVVAYDPSSSEGYILLGDVLQATDPAGAGRAYQRASEINTKNGEVWAKIAIVHTMSEPPDWIRTLQAASRAQQLGYDSANLRTAMAGAEFGRADLFRRSGRIEQAEDAELAARRHLERARELAPDSPEVTANVSRLMAKYLLEQKRYKEATQTLELLAVQYPNDLQVQTLYARALEGHGRRGEDTFIAWSRVWKLTGESEVPLDATRYAVIADGFDQRLFGIGKNIFQLTTGVSTGAMLRETAILQTTRSKEELKTAVATLNLLKPPPGKATSEAHINRLFAADLMQQALEFYAVYLETGNDLNRTRAVETHRQAIENLNLARAASTGTA